MYLLFIFTRHILYRNGKLLKHCHINHVKYVLNNSITNDYIILQNIYKYFSHDNKLIINTLLPFIMINHIRKRTQKGHVFPSQYLYNVACAYILYIDIVLQNGKLKCFEQYVVNGIIVHLYIYSRTHSSIVGIS